MAALRVFLIDDLQIMADAMAAGLAALPDIWVLGRCATDDPRLVDVVARARPDVITLEVESLGVSAGGVIDRIHGVLPAVRIVVLTATSDPAVALAVARAGADAWLTTDITLERLAAVLWSVHAGAACYPEALLGTVLRELRGDARRDAASEGALDVLSVREREVLLEMVEGRTGREIAQRLTLSTNTVRTHIRSILVKLDVHSRLEAVAVARAAGQRPRGARPSGEARPLQTT